MNERKATAKILLIDDDPHSLRLLEELLKGYGYVVYPSPNGEFGLPLAKRYAPDLILLDIMMPGINGYQVCEQLKADVLTRDIPVIFITALYDIMDKLKGFEVGGVDYITKPFQAEEVLVRVRTHLTLSLLQQQLKTQNLQLQQEVLERKQAEERLLRAKEEVRKARDELELRVQERTRELSQMNTSLVQEVTDHKRTANALKVSEHQYRLLIEHVADGIGILQDQEVVFVNETLAAMFGSTPRQFEGKAPQELFRGISEDMFPKIEAQHQERQPLDLKWQILEFIATEEGREIWLEGQHTSILWHGRPAILLTLRDITERKRKETEIKSERQQLLRENILLRSAMKERYRFGNIIGKSQAMQEVYELITRAAATEANIVIYGESGTGKDLIAQTIHQMSDRREQAFVPVNCGSIQETLFESEFFGYRKGAFTGAYKDKQGFFDAAHQGTLFLDEVGELSLTMQVKLLRAIEGKGYTPVGSHTVKQADIRIIAATNRNLKEHVKQGLMREDFFYRINVIPITVPPLRERREDIPLLIEHFLHQYADHHTLSDLPGGVLNALYSRDWPGNIRQLQNVLQRYITLKRLDFDDELQATTPEGSTEQEGPRLREALEEFERNFILKTLDQNQGNRGKTAENLNIPPRTLRRKLEKYHIK
ncbi:PAS modulated sigma54 specific transcriptional regulator, Fis family [Candidatus Vecturithrix granuli]|uniref:PAS modulated sigma54 specific transcriptional regulator, Fis family n=1 Tax=Vecturithrix granuli TaxID=1499967 RepID=A0A081C1L4_VECG1|nr:PAS modulated sigma54 specific transcriptional regulator, Fis family [Candidatus Vecturithrix granuli]